jgi:mRNA interferase MazF
MRPHINANWLNGKPLTAVDLSPGDIVWVKPDPSVGREQAGRRPALVVSGADCLATVDTLAIVVPITSVDRGWPNHVPVDGLDKPSWAMTEQVRTISRERILGAAARGSTETLADVRRWISDFLALD